MNQWAPEEAEYLAALPGNAYSTEAKELAMVKQACLVEAFGKRGLAERMRSKVMMLQVAWILRLVTMTLRLLLMMIVVCHSTNVEFVVETELQKEHVIVMETLLTSVEFVADQVLLKVNVIVMETF